MRVFVNFLDLYSKLFRIRIRELGGRVLPLGLFSCFSYTDLSQVFLYTCIICSIIVVLAKLKSWRKLWCCYECRRNCPTATETYRGLFISLTFIVLVGAFGVFISLPTTNKSLTLENSRDQNEECAFLGFSTGTIFGVFCPPLVS